MTNWHADSKSFQVRFQWLPASPLLPFEAMAGWLLISFDLKFVEEFEFVLVWVFTFSYSPELNRFGNGRSGPLKPLGS